MKPIKLAPKRGIGYAQVALNIGLYLIAIYAATFVQNIYWALLVFVGLGFSLNRLFYPTHDCIHYSLFPVRQENVFWGKILSSFLGTTYEAIGKQHIDHHKYFGNQNDPGFIDYSPVFKSRKELIKFLISPLFGEIIFRNAKNYINRNSTKEHVESSWACLAIIQGSLLLTVTRGLQFEHLWRYPVFVILPAITIFLFLNRLRMFLEHGSTNYQECNYLNGVGPVTRTIYGSTIERMILCGSNFNYHNEHHKQMYLPGWALPIAHSQASSKENVYPTYLAVMKEIWHYLGRPESFKQSERENLLLKAK